MELVVGWGDVELMLLVVVTTDEVELEAVEVVFVLLNGLAIAL